MTRTELLGSICATHQIQSRTRRRPRTPTKTAATGRRKSPPTIIPAKASCSPPTRPGVFPRGSPRSRAQPDGHEPQRGNSSRPERRRRSRRSLPRKRAARPNRSAPACRSCQQEAARTDLGLAPEPGGGSWFTRAVPCRFPYGRGSSPSKSVPPASTARTAAARGRKAASNTPGFGFRSARRSPGGNIAICADDGFGEACALFRTRRLALATRRTTAQKCEADQGSSQLAGRGHVQPSSGSQRGPELGLRGFQHPNLYFVDFFVSQGARPSASVRAFGSRQITRK